MRSFGWCVAIGNVLAWTGWFGAEFDDCDGVCYKVLAQLIAVIVAADTALVEHYLGLHG